MKRGFLISVGAYLGLWLVLEALFPAPSYAYLDPGTGNVLVYLAISLVGTVLYFVKNIVYAIMGRAKGERRPEKQLHHERILMFSEGRSYYYTFKPVIDAFLRRGVPFSYITMDVEDPALTIENDLMNSRYIGTGSAAFARAAGRRADIMLSTTPNIGTPGFPMPRPRRVTNLAHICHGVGDIAMYQKGSLDHYDAVLMVGDFMLPSIRKVEELRGLPPKECVSLGLPYLDELAAKARKKEGRSTPPVVLVAPSWGNKGCLNICGPNFLLDLAKAGYDVILRPHPQSLKVETEMLDTIHEMLRDYPNVSFDTEMDATASMSRADVMISDKSCVRFDFAFLYEKPVITLDIPVRTLECCSGDLADLKVKSCDIEAWSPRQQKYFEVCSCSNLGDAQARRLHIRIKGKDGKNYLAHTLNNTCVAPPRMLIALLENNLQPDGSVVIPEALRAYMGGTEVLVPKH